jgi:hypothetical protein
MATAAMVRAAKGAALLDEKMPGWARRVDPERLSEKPLDVQLFGPHATSGLLDLLKDAPERRVSYRGKDGETHWRTRDAILVAPEYGLVVSERRFEPSYRYAWRNEIEARTGAAG